MAHLEQASAVATEVTSSIVRLKLEVEEKKRAITLLQTALVCSLDTHQPGAGVRARGPAAVGTRTGPSGLACTLYHVRGQLYHPLHRKASI